MQSAHNTTETKPYGLMAEFDTPESVVAAAQKAYDAGYRKMDAYSPFPVHGLDEAVGFRKNYVSLVVLIGGLTGAATGFLMQYIGMVVHYPYNAGGKPFFSWPMFVPITFELGILFAAFSAVIGMFAMNGLPLPYHPVFNVARFREAASRDAFFLCIESTDDRFDEAETRSFLESLGPKAVSVVEP